MNRPAYGPVATWSTGAAGPNPSIPSCTIVPEVIATSTALAPQPLLSIAMSIPWSSVQELDGITMETGWSGNTQPLVPASDRPGVSTTPEPFAVFLTAASSVAAVTWPTTPVTGERFWAVWNWMTAALVIEPK